MSDDVIGTYRLVEKIGEGGMGEVYRAVDDSIQRKVAIKFLRADLARNPDILDRFRQEAQVLGSLNHPNIAALYNFGRDGDRWYMVMEFTDGQSLENVIQANPAGLALDWALFLFRQALVAIKHAHEFGVVHRDIKPANMMVNSRAVLKVLDFGIARVLGSVRMTRLGTAMGTATYMSPEQVLGDNTDERSDIYSLAVVLYELLTGKPPFAMLTEFELMTAQVKAVPESMRTRVPTIPDYIDSAVMQALAKAPADRFQSAHYFLEALGRLPFQMPTTLPPPGLEVTSAVSRTVPLGRAGTGEQATAASGVRSRENSVPPLDSAIPKTRLLGPDDAGRPDLRPPAAANHATEAVPEGEPAATRRINEPIPMPTGGTQWPSKGKLVLIAASVSATVLGGLWLLTPKPVAQDVQRAREFIAKSEQAYAANRVLAPFGDNAVDYLDQAMKLAPHDASAERLARQILERSIGQGNDALKRGEIATARARRNDAQQLVRHLKLSDKSVVELASNIQAAERSLAESRVRDEQRAKRAQQINDLLAKARRALTAGHLTQPKDANVTAYVRQVLNAAPENTEAKQLIADTAAAMVKRSEDFLRLEDLGTAVAMKDEAAALIGEFKLSNDLLTALEGHIKEATKQQERLAQQLAEAAALETRVNALVNEGQDALRAGRVNMPDGNSALDYVRQALAADAKSSSARKLAEQIIERLLLNADSQLSGKALDDAENSSTSAKALAAELGVRASRLDDVVRRVVEARRALAARMAQEEKQVQTLLSRAREAMQASRILEQGGAVELAAQVLKLRPASEQAFDIVVDAVSHLRDDAEAAIARNELDLGERKYHLATEVTDRFGLEKPAIDELGDKIQKEKARLAEQEAQRLREAAEQKAEANRKAAELQQTLDRAKAAFADARYLSPEGDSAAGLAAQVLDLDANNTAARALLTEVVTKVLGQCKAKLEAEAIEEAQALLDSLRPIVDKQKLEPTRLDDLSRRIAQIEQRRAQVETQRIASEQAKEREQAAGKARREAEIKDLVDRGRRALEQGHITSPSGDNAVSYAERLLQLQKDSADARGLLGDILAQMLRTARLSLEAGKFDEVSRQQGVAEKFARKYALDDGEVLALGEALTNERSRQDAAEREKTEQQRQKQAEASRAKAEADAEKAREAARVQSERSNAFLEKARTALQGGRLTEPAGDNTVDYAAQILKTDPRNGEARRLLEEVLGQIVAAGELALSRNDKAAARQQLRSAETLARRHGLGQSQLKRLGTRLANSERPAPTVAVRPTVSTPVQVPTRSLARLPDAPAAVQELPPVRRPEPVPAEPTLKPAGGGGGNTFVPPSF